MIYRHAEIADAPALSMFAMRVFVNSFEDRLPRAELEAIAAARFPSERQHDDIASADGDIFLALDPDLIGYVHLLYGTRPDCPLAADAPAELKRIYVDAGWHGRGVAQALLALAEHAAREHGCDIFWLAVWDANDRGQAFYDKLRFKKIGSAVIQVGTLELGHHFLAKTLS